jgi:hypothetical protein
MEIGSDLKAAMQRRWFSMWPTFDIQFDDPNMENIVVVKGWWRGVEFIRGGRKIAVLTRPNFSWTWKLQVEDDCDDLPEAFLLLAVGNVYHQEILRGWEREADRQGRREM